MDKKIEEMVNVMLEYALSIDGFSPEIKYAMQSVATTQAIKRALRGYATALINAGYRKIPEGAVVLTKEEFSEKIENTWLNCQEFTRKETAEKFAEMVKMAFYYEFDELIPSIMADKIDEICKEITEGKNDGT